MAFPDPADGSFIAYLLAFYMLWTVWRQHHRLFDRIGHVSFGLLGWFFPLFLLIGFLPYPTAVHGHHIDYPAAVIPRAAGTGLPIDAYVTVLPPADPAVLPAHLARLRAAGATRFSLYHLGLASAERQELLRHSAAAAVHS